MHFLLLILLTSTFARSISAQPLLDNPAFRKLWNDFKRRNKIKGNSLVEFQMIRNGASAMKLGQRWVSLLNKDLEAVKIFAPEASVIVDGMSRAPRQMVFKSKKEENVLITKDMATGRLISAIAKLDNGKVENIVPIDDWAYTFAAVVVDDLDGQELNQYVLAEAIAPPTSNRSLRDYSNVGAKSERLRILQASCSEFDVIEISVVIDSLFCAEHGGEIGAQAKVQSIIAAASQYYEAPGLCVKLQLKEQIYSCNPDNDPIRPIADGNTVCSGLLRDFADFVASESISGDVVHLFHGKNLPGDGNTIGCAWSGTLCRKDGFGSGVNKMSFSDILSVQAQLLAHENGHICNAGHVNDSNDVMAPSLCSGSNCSPVEFGPISRQSISSKIEASTCTSVEGPETPPLPPTPPPSPAFTSQPQPSKPSTPAPSLPPTIMPTLPPTPAPAPVKIPTSRPDESEPSIVLEADFLQSEEGFIYEDDLFRGTNAAAYSVGTHSTADGGYLEVTLGGVDNNDINDMSGGWSSSFDLPKQGYVSVTLNFELGQASNYESNEFSQALCSIDAMILGNYIAEVRGNGNGGDTVVVRDTVTISGGLLSAGTHIIAVGAYNNRKTYADEYTWARFESIVITVSDHESETPTCADNPNFTFFVNGQLVGCDWIGQQTPGVSLFVCGYSFINQECKASCGQC